MPQSARRAIGGAGALIALLVALYAAIHIGVVQRADASALRGFSSVGQHPRVHSLARSIVRLCDPDPYVYLCAVPIAVALVRRRGWVALAIGAILLGANVTTELLKPALDVQRAVNVVGAPGTGSWPSGHATAAMALGLCCVLAVPARLRPAIAAVGAAFAVVVSYAFLSLEWHYPTDVLGGYLVAAIWTLLGMATVWTAYSHRTQRLPGGPLSQRPSLWAALGPPTIALLTALGLALLVVVARPHEVVAYVGAHEAFVLGAVGIGALGLALATGIMLATRR